MCFMYIVSYFRYIYTLLDFTHAYIRRLSWVLLPNISTVNEVLHSVSSPVDLVLVVSFSPLSWPQSIIVLEPDGKFGFSAYQILLIITPFVPYRTYRVLGFIVLACDIIAVILVKDRVKRPLFQKKKLSDILKFDVFKHPPYRIWALAATIQLMPYFVPFYYLPCKLHHKHFDITCS